MVEKSNNPGGGKPHKIIRDALLAVQRNEPERLKRVAQAWWDAAETDQAARSALADRLDGKSIQPIAHAFTPEQPDDAAIDAELIEFLRKAGIAAIATSQAQAENEGGLPNIH